MKLTGHDLDGSIVAPVNNYCIIIVKPTDNNHQLQKSITIYRNKERSQLQLGVITGQYRIIIDIYGIMRG